MNVEDEPSLRVLINQIDHTLAAPGPLDNATLPRVPIIRIYGASSTGEKACVHIHQVYPYFFVEYTGKMTPDCVNRYIDKLSVSLNHAIALSIKRNPYSQNSQFIRAVLLVKGVDFYGFHASYTPFLKILLADPAFVNRAVTLMRSGTVMRTKYRVYESHLGYLLQFMCDFGLYGCGWINLREVWQRGLEERDITTLESASFKTSPHFRQSRMPLEVDVVAHQILNRHLLSARSVHYQLAIPAPPLPSEPVVLSVRELWEDERRRRAAKGLSPTPLLPVDPSDASRESGGDWIAEARWWEQLVKKIQREREERRSTIEDEDGWEKWVMTTFESVEALWEVAWRSWKPGKAGSESEVSVNNVGVPDRLENPFAQASQGGTWAGASTNIDADVDEAMLSSQVIDQMILDQEEQELEKYADDGEANDGLDEDEHFGEEGLLPDDQMESGNEQSEVSNTRSSTPSPFLDERTPSNPFENAWSRLAISNDFRCMGHSPFEVGTRKRPRSLSLDSHVFFTPTKSMRLSHKQMSVRAALSTSGAPYMHSRPRASYSSLSGNQLLDGTPGKCFSYALCPPLASELLSTIEKHGLPRKIYRDPFYSKNVDVPDNPREYAGLIYRLRGSDGLEVLEDWQSNDEVFLPIAGVETPPSRSGGWEFASCPPGGRQVRKWLKDNPAVLVRKANMRSQIEGRTQTNLYGMKSVPLRRSKANTRNGQLMTLFSLEVFAPSRSGRMPDANIDEIAAVFYAVGNDDIYSTLHDQGVLVVRNARLNSNRLRGFPIEIVADELELINRVIDIVVDLDPDIVLGWEVQAASWGYLNTRGICYGLDVGELISRAPQKNSEGNDQWGAKTTTTFKAAGRHVFNVWRIMRSEQNLGMYSFENGRVPRYTPATLTSWFNSDNPVHTSRVLTYFHDRTIMTLDILGEAETTTKNAEFARVFGVDFYSVISRGSQFKVESFMFRIAKPESFVLLSPSKQDVGKQNAAECMPLIMEPLSALYNGPLVVLDFQSLYPSIMIAYNYCYSTCLGRTADFQGRNKFGVTDLELPPGLLEKLQDNITIAPNGIMYVKPIVRRGLLGRMLTELLDTRVMVKQAMKSVRADKALSRILDARQLGLKYIANVTYGYTSATYSGRMPAVEIADSIVQSGRETLEKAINIINATEKWGACVVYGDTDSLFVYLQGKTKEQAFQIGYDIADTITKMNPAPVKLKFEKVYLPCVLMAKKRYVGFKYETPDEVAPVFDAKGIETVRRDGVVAQSKMTEACIKSDLSEVKAYCCRSWSKILRNKLSIQDFIFAKEVRMGTYSDKAPPPPGVAVAARRMLEDENYEPQYGDRVPYLIIRGGSPRLVDRAVTPEELLANGGDMHIDAGYYISRVLIPPLERVFNLVGADVRAWYDEMPKAIKVDEPDPLALSPKKPRRITANVLKIDEHFQSPECFACGGFASEGICEDCQVRPQESLPHLLWRLRRGEEKLLNTHRVCASCSSAAFSESIECLNTDCPWLYERKKAEQKADFLEGLWALMDDMGLTDEEAWT
ncbi:hypothetical protein F5I97DRAFT_2041862 [Phlebopus sp. FC_14]|nr:hypothetical protein F5I97DRAFT_2041862 [Phlebopus sp. FC_14]